MTDERADYDAGHGTVEYAYERFQADEYADHLDARRDRSDREVVPDPRPQRRTPRSQVHPLVSWKMTVLERDMGCCVHRNPADCDFGWQAHHVVAQQELRRSRPDLLWNPLSGMGVCGLAHRQHHNRVRPILLDEIPAAVVVFLREAGYSAYLERHYP